MRTLKMLAIICFIGLLLQIYAYINLMVSYKYEVDLMQTHVDVSEMSMKEKTKEYHRITLREQEITHQQKVTKRLFCVFLIGSIILLYLILRRRKLDKA